MIFCVEEKTSCAVMGTVHYALVETSLLQCVASEGDNWKMVCWTGFVLCCMFDVLGYLLGTTSIVVGVG